MSHMELGTKLSRRAFLKKAVLAGGLISALPVLAACTLAPPPAGSAPATNEPAATTEPSVPTPTSGLLPVAQETVAPTPTAGAPAPVAERYFRAWERGRYEDMYALLSREATKSISQSRFVKRYQDITTGCTILSVKVDYDPSKVQRPAPDEATFEFTVHMQTARLGEIVETNTLPLYVEDGQWKVDWTPSLIFKDLSGRNLVRLFTDNPARGTIFDRQGKPLAVQGTVISVGVVPGRIENRDQVAQALKDALGVEPEVFQKLISNAQPDWFVPIKDLSEQAAKPIVDKLASVPGITTRERQARVYPNGSVAAHVIGYVSSITAEELAELSVKGYEDGDVIGRDGIEAWGEELLAGEKGGKLAIVSPAGEVLKVIAEKPAKPGADLYLTIDIDKQKRAESIMEDHPGSVIVMDVKENTILAMASVPSFDPNSFVLGFSTAEWDKLSKDERRPFQNRPCMSQYPTGSIFKPITMCCALERGGFSPGSPFYCPGYWNGLGVKMACWSVHGQTDVLKGLAQSCNVVHYEEGKKLDSIDPNLLPEYARGFGLGAPTGLVGLREAEGTVPDPAWKRANIKEDWYPGDAVNMAIGQGFVQATPLQMVNAYAAIARGGSLQTPILVKKVVREGQEIQNNVATEKGRLPASAATLQLVKQGMVNVVSADFGSAADAFRGLKLSLAGKTGSAENVSENAHAWFAGFPPADDPDIALIVMLEAGGMGAQRAAPRARKLLELWYNLTPGA